MQVVAGAFDHEEQFLPHVAVLAGLFAVLEKLHIGLDAAFAGIHLLVHEVLDQPVGRTFPRHIRGLDHVRQGGVVGAEFFRRDQIVGEEGADGGA